MKAIPVSPIAGWPDCVAVHPMITATETVIHALEVMSNLRRPQRSMKYRPASVEIIMIGVCSALQRSCERSEVIPAVWT